jgi:hypothetical protein
VLGLRPNWCRVARNRSIVNALSYSNLGIKFYTRLITDPFSMRYVISMVKVKCS